MLQAVYLSLFVLSVIFLFIYMRMYVKQHGIHYIAFGIMTAFTNFNYLVLSYSRNSELSLFAQVGVFVGMMFIPIVIINIASELCKSKNNIITEVLMIFAGALVLLIVTTKETGFFYKTYEVDAVTGIITRTYGFAHTLYYVYLGISFVYAIYIVVSNRKKTDISRMSHYIVIGSGVILLASILVIYILPFKFYCDAVALVLMDVMFLIICKKLPLYDVETAITEAVDNNKMMGIIVFDDRFKLLGYNKYLQTIMPEVENWHVDKRITEKFKYYAQLIDMVEAFKTAGDVYETTFEVHDRYYLNKMTRLKMNGKDYGYQILIFDNTDAVLYRQLIENFNEELRAEVKRQTDLLVKIENSMVFGMAEMVESRDLSTGGHIKRTSSVVKILTDDLKKRKQFEVSENFYDYLIKAAPLHDLGKLAVDDIILRKPGRFTPEEFEQMKQHAARGGEIVSKVLKNVRDPEFVSMTKNVAQYHHERWDSNGYPEHLVGENIPLEARIMAIADVYDALVSKRVYKDSYDFEKAYNIIIDGMGTQFDPELKECFCNCVPLLEAYYSNLDE